MSYDNWKSNQYDYSEPTTPQADEAGDEEDRKQQAGIVFPYKGHRVELVLSPGVGCYGHILIDGVSRLRETNLLWLWLAEKRAIKLIDENKASAPTPPLKPEPVVPKFTDECPF